jgi:hypothetical protein
LPDADLASASGMNNMGAAPPSGHPMQRFCLGRTAAPDGYFDTCRVFVQYMLRFTRGLLTTVHGTLGFVSPGVPLFAPPLSKLFLTLVSDKGPLSPGDPSTVLSRIHDPQ